MLRAVTSSPSNPSAAATTSGSTTTTAAGATTTTVAGATTTTAAGVTTTTKGSTTKGHGHTTTTTTTPPSQAVKVLVANGSSTTGAAGFFTTKLSSAGWGTLTATDTSTPVSGSAVYYASGQQGPATAIAASLGLKPSVVQPLTTSVPVSGTTGADVVVVIGPDLSSQVTTDDDRLTDLPAVLAPFRDRPDRSALFLDYDGTLAPIVDDPAAARPLAAVPELLADLGRRFGLVAVVSGRPVRFLLDVLGRPAGRPPGRPLRHGSGPAPAARSSSAPTAEAWRPVVADVTARAAGRGAGRGDGRGEGPDGDAALAAPTRRRGLGPGAGGSGDARPPASSPRPAGCRSSCVRRSTATRARSSAASASGWAAVACFGDDLGDLPAFDALDDLAAGGVAVARVAVVDAESPPEVAAAADVVVDGPQGAVALLRQLVDGDDDDDAATVLKY